MVDHAAAMEVDGDEGAGVEMTPKLAPDAKGEVVASDEPATLCGEKTSQPETAEPTQQQHEPPPKPTKQHSTQLTEWLESVGQSSWGPLLRSHGYYELQDLRVATADDLLACGMKRGEMRRLLSLVPQRSQQADTSALSELQREKVGEEKEGRERERVAGKRADLDIKPGDSPPHGPELPSKPVAAQQPRGRLLSSVKTHSNPDVLEALQGHWICDDGTQMRVHGSDVHDLSHSMVGRFISTPSNQISLDGAVILWDESSDTRIQWSDQDIWFRWGTICPNKLCLSDISRGSRFCQTCGNQISKFKRTANIEELDSYLVEVKVEREITAGGSRRFGWCRDAKLRVLHVDRQSPAWRAGVRANMKIVAVEGHRVSSADDLKEILRGLELKKEILFSFEQLPGAHDEGTEAASDAGTGLFTPRSGGRFRRKFRPDDGEEHTEASERRVSFALRTREGRDADGKSQHSEERTPGPTSKRRRLDFDSVESHHGEAGSAAAPKLEFFPPGLDVEVRRPSGYFVRGLTVDGVRTHCGVAEQQVLLGTTGGEQSKKGATVWCGLKSMKHSLRGTWFYQDGVREMKAGCEVLFEVLSGGHVRVREGSRIVADADCSTEVAVGSFTRAEVRIWEGSTLYDGILDPFTSEIVGVVKAGGVRGKKQGAFMLTRVGREPVAFLERNPNPFVLPERVGDAARLKELIRQKKIAACKAVGIARSPSPDTEESVAGSPRMKAVRRRVAALSVRERSRSRPPAPISVRERSRSRPPTHPNGRERSAARATREASLARSMRGAGVRRAASTARAPSAPLTPRVRVSPHPGLMFAPFAPDCDLLWTSGDSERRRVTVLQSMDSQPTDADSECVVQKCHMDDPDSGISHHTVLARALRLRPESLVGHWMVREEVEREAHETLLYITYDGSKLRLAVLVDGQEVPDFDSAGSGVETGAGTAMIRIRDVRGTGSNRMIQVYNVAVAAASMFGTRETSRRSRTPATHTVTLERVKYDFLLGGWQMRSTVDPGSGKTVLTRLDLSTSKATWTETADEDAEDGEAGPAGSGFVSTELKIIDGKPHKMLTLHNENRKGVGWRFLKMEIPLNPTVLKGTCVRKDGGGEESRYHVELARDPGQTAACVISRMAGSWTYSDGAWELNAKILFTISEQGAISVTENSKRWSGQAARIIAGVGVTGRCCRIRLERHDRKLITTSFGILSRDHQMLHGYFKVDSAGGDASVLKGASGTFLLHRNDFTLNEKKVPEQLWVPRGAQPPDDWWQGRWRFFSAQQEETGSLILEFAPGGARQFKLDGETKQPVDESSLTLKSTKPLSWAEGSGKWRMEYSVTPIASASTEGPSAAKGWGKLPRNSTSIPNKWAVRLERFEPSADAQQREPGASSEKQ